MTPINSSLPVQNDPWAGTQTKTEDTQPKAAVKDPWAGDTDEPAAAKTAAPKDPWASDDDPKPANDDPWAGRTDDKFSGSVPAKTDEQPAAEEQKPELADDDEDDFWAQAAAAKKASHTQFGRVVTENFDKLDTDGDGYIGHDEIDAAMKDKNIKGELAAAVSTLKDRVSDLEDMSNDEIGFENDGVTRDDIDQYEKESREGGKDAQKIDGRFTQAAYKIRDTNRALFPTGSPDAKSVEQGNIGDCWFVSAMASRTAVNPDAVKRSIVDNGDGTYNVKLGDDDIKVDAPTDSEIGYGATAGANGLWMTVAEKAEAKRANTYTYFGQTFKSNDNDYDAIDHGASIGTGVSDVTGSGTDHDFLTFASYDTTRDKLEETLGDKKVVTAGIRKNIFGSNRRNGMPMGHAYSVIGYDRKTDTVTVRNPWGSTELTDDNGNPRDGKDDGLMTMSLEEFDDNFTDVSYED